MKVLDQEVPSPFPLVSELVWIIISHLDLDEILLMGRVCKQWRKFISPWTQRICFINIPECYHYEKILHIYDTIGGITNPFQKLTINTSKGKWDYRKV